MGVLIRLRWVLLIVALATGLLVVLPLLFPMIDVPNVGTAILAPFLVVGLCQPVGVFAMSQHLRASGRRAGWAMVVGYAAAFAWFLVWLSAGMANAAA